MERLFLSIAASIAAAACIFAMWHEIGALRADNARLKAALVVENRNEKIVTKYVDRVVKVPGPAVVRERLVRGVCHVIELPGPGRADDAAGADPGAGQIDPTALAADIAAAQRNKLKLEALQEALRPQL